MATVAARLDVSIDRGGLDASLSAQGDLIAEALALVEALRSGDLGSLAGFAARIAALDLPASGVGQEALEALRRAEAALPADLAAASGGTLGEIARFGTQAGQSLLPVLEKVTAAARAIETLAGIELRCPPGGAQAGVGAGAAAGGAAGGDGAPAEGEAGAATGASRAEAVTARLDDVDAILGFLPEPLTVGALVSRLMALTRGSRRNDFLGITVPVLDDVLLPLQTMTAWEAMTDAELSASLQVTLESLRQRLEAAAPGRLGAALAEATALAGPLDAAAFAAAHQQVLDAGAALAAAIEGGDGGAIQAAAAALDTALDALAAQEGAIAAGFTAPAARAARRLAAAPGDVADHLVHLAVQLEPVDPGAFLRALPAPGTPDPDLKAELEEALAPVTAFMEDLTALLDLSSIQDEIAGAAGEAQQLADRVQQALAEVAGTVRAAFAEADAALDALDLDAVAAEVRDEITRAGERIEQAVARAFEPLRAELEAAVAQLAAALDALDLEAVAEALEGVVQSVAGVLNDPEVKGAVDEARAALEDVAGTLRGLSFAPVTDEVIALIEEMTKGLKAVAEGDLNDAVKGALGTALGLLPPDLAPATDPLVDEFGRRVEAGPVVLMAAIRAQPARVLDTVRAFEPAALAGGTLGAPFRELTGALGAVSPRALLAPVRVELDSAKQRIKAQAAPSKALEPVAAAFDRLRAQVAALSPAAVLDPIEDALQQAIDEVLSAVPVEDALAEIGGVFDTLEAVLGMVGRAGATLGRLEAALDAMAEGDAQIDAWRDAILDRLDGLPDQGGLQGGLTAVRDAAAATGHGALLARWDGDAAPLVAALGTLDARGRLAASLSLRQRLGSLAAGLAPGAAADAVAPVLARFDPLDPAGTAGLRAAVGLGAAVEDGRARLEELGSVWAGALHGEDATLALLATGGVDPAALRGVVRPDVDRALGPLRQLTARLAHIAPVAGALASTAGDLQARIDAALGDVLTGPDGLASIAEDMERVVAALRGLDLAALREGIEGVFDAVEARLDAIGPRPLLETLDREFADIVDAIDLDLVIPAEPLDQLEASLDALRLELGQLDPEALVISAVQPVWERDVLPMIEALDLTPIFDALIETLQELDEELRAEIGRVNGAYQGLLAARPAGIGGISVSVSIG